MLPTSERTSSRDLRARQPREPASRRLSTLPGISTRLRQALDTAGIPPDAVETRIQMTPETIEIRLVQGAGRELTLDQLATIATVLRASEASNRAICTGVA